MFDSVDAAVVVQNRINNGLGYDLRTQGAQSITNKLSPYANKISNGLQAMQRASEAKIGLGATAILFGTAQAGLEITGVVGGVAGVKNAAEALMHTIERNAAAANIRQARNLLREANASLQSRNQIIRSFDLETFRIKTLSSEITAYRYFDDTKAAIRGRYVTTDMITNQTDRIQNLALMRNSATRVAEVSLPEGSVVFTGRAASQPNFGPGLTGGGNQLFLTGSLSNYNFREVFLPR
ncbi:hypothetical protein ACW4YW_15420 [Methylobacillus pratensis]